MKLAITLNKLSAHAGASNDVAKTLSKRLHALAANSKGDLGMESGLEINRLTEFADQLVEATKATKNLLEEL